MHADSLLVTDVMVDTETLGTKPGCAILAIGAMAFDPRKPWNIVTGQEIAEKHRFMQTVSLESCVDAGLVIEPGSLRFWLEQPEAAQKEAFSGTEHLRVALSLFEYWFSRLPCGPGGINLWSHGAPFDPPILARAYELFPGERVPWDFRKLRDTRTAFEIAGLEYKGKHHTVIRDCLDQCEKVCEAYGILGLHALPEKPRESIDWGI